MSAYPSTHDRQPAGPIPLQTGLHDKQKRLLTYINLYTQKNGVPPSVREAKRALGHSSTSVTVYHLEALVARGLLLHVANSSRAYRLPRTMQKETHIS